MKFMVEPGDIADAGLPVAPAAALDGAENLGLVRAEAASRQSQGGGRPGREKVDHPVAVNQFEFRDPLRGAKRAFPVFSDRRTINWA